MKLAVLAATAALGIAVMGVNVSTAEAAGGCGPAFHRNPWGYCRPNLGYGFYRPGWGPGYHGWHGGWHRSWHRWHRW